MEAHFHNLTHVFEKVEYHIRNGTFVVADQTTETMVTQAIILIAAFLSFTSNLVIIFSTIKNSNTLNSNLDTLILHISIFGNFIIILQCALVFDDAKYLVKNISETLYCFLDDLWGVLMQGIIFFMILIKIYWFSRIYAPDKNAWLQKYFQSVIKAVYILLGLLILLHLEACVNWRLYQLPISLLILFTGIYAAFIVGLDVIHVFKRKSYKKYITYDISFIVPNLFLLAWMPLLLNILFAFYYFRFINVSKIVGMLYPVYVCFVLFLYDEHYNLAFKNFFRCRRKLDHVIVNTQENV
ncbi:unnamed protein product [Brassicogethes aeneus]|uniref:Uncharacterized protein n=1 Tax=Brassicogethes aeneus TaxID=1431903 RepID=A0A9P0B5F1_BRAAE|nr:unnamed protein product [Brassicogethes aeneus]